MVEEAGWCGTCEEVTAHGLPADQATPLAFGGLAILVLVSPWPCLVVVPLVLGIVSEANELSFARIACGRCRERARRASSGLILRRGTEVFWI